MIRWITRLFTEALEWQHEDEFLCVAFQNRVAHAMGGNTLHAGGDIGVGGQRSLDHTAIEVQFTRTQYRRWVIIDELPMVPDDLLGAFASHLADAASPSRYQKKWMDQCVSSEGTIFWHLVISIRSRRYLPPHPSPSLLSTRKRRQRNTLWTCCGMMGRTP